MLPVLVAALVASTADVSVTCNSLLTARPGGPIQYFINVRNAGPDAATSVVLTDPIPSNTGFIAEAHPNGTTCTSPDVGGPGTVTCTIPMIQSGAVVSLFIEVQASATLPQQSTISNTVTVTSANDPNSANNSSTAMTTIFGSVYVSTALSVTSSGPPAAMAGATIAYSIAIANGGPIDAANVSLIDAIPMNSTFVSIVQTAGPAFACIASAGGRRGAFCTLATLLSGQSAAFVVTIRVDPGCPSKLITNMSLINSDTPSLIGAKMAINDTPITAVPGSGADLSVSVSTPRSAPPGSVITSYIELINTGPADATNVTLAYDTPAETTFADLVYPSGTTCFTPALRGTGTVRCSIPILPNEGSVILVAGNQLSTDPSGAAIHESFTVANAADPDLTYNTATATVLIDSADLSIAQTADRFFAMPGATIVYTIDVANRGPATASGVTVDDSLPSGVTLLSMTPSQGVCSDTSCSLGAIASGQKATITLAVIAPTAAGRIVNTAVVRASTTDPGVKNNSSTAAVTVVIPVKH